MALGRVTGKVLINWETPTYKSFVFSGLISSEFLQHQLNISFSEIFVYSRDNVVKLVGREPEENFGVIHIAERFTVFWNSKEVVYM